MKVEKKDTHEGQKSVTVWFDEDVIERLNRLAEKGDVPRSRLVRNLAVIGIEYLEACENFGILQTALIIRNFGDRVKEWCKSGIDGDVAKV